MLYNKRERVQTAPEGRQQNWQSPKKKVQPVAQIRVKQPEKRRVNTGLLTKLLILILLAAVTWRLVALQDQIRAAEVEQERVAAEVESQKQENDALSADIAEGCTPEKMQEIARRELGWVLPGEYVFEVGS